MKVQSYLSMRHCRLRISRSVLVYYAVILLGGIRGWTSSGTTISVAVPVVAANDQPDEDSISPIINNNTRRARARTRTTISWRKGEKVQVFILGGQSNMQGKGYLPMLAELAEHNLTRHIYQEWFKSHEQEANKQTNNTWTMADKEHVHCFLSSLHHALPNVKISYGVRRSCPLTVGYGTPNKERFGSELEFGRVLSNYMSYNPPSPNHKEDADVAAAMEATTGKSFLSQLVHLEEREHVYIHPKKVTVPILLIKSAFGGKSLQKDFLPPSMVIPNYTQLVRSGNASYMEEVKQSFYSDKRGEYYRALIDSVHLELDSIRKGKVFDGLTEYELRGMVWWQGWADLIDPSRYATHLRALIEDIRTDLNISSPRDLPVVIGEAGQLGIVPHRKKNRWPQVESIQLRRAQREVAHNQESSVRFVPTSHFVSVLDKPPLSGGRDADDYNNMDAHYYGRADTFFRAGRAFGEAMVELLEDFRDANVESVG